MRTIHKYSLDVARRQVVHMPHGATVLSVQVQFGVPCVWAEVNPNAQLREEAFYMYGTGDSIAEERLTQRYLGTIQLSGGAFVYHVYQA